jgi:hypothetical protein
MKNRTRRRLGAWTRTPLAVGSGILTIAGFVATVSFAIFGGSARSWVWLALTATVAATVAVRFALVRDASGDPTFFLRLTFDDLTARQRDETITRLAQGGSATPEFASVAPAPDELSVVLDQLAFDRVSYISGGSGEGKSTLAYHAARELSSFGYTTYELCGPVLEGFSREYIREKILPQVDRLRGKARLIVVDDAQLLEWADDVREVLLGTLDDNDTAIVWIWTDYPELLIGRTFEDASVRINYANLAVKQEIFFQDNLNRGKLRSSQAALEEAVSMSGAGEIRTAWQYSFVAYGGSQRLAAGLASLTNLERFVLFEISARVVAVGALGMPVSEAQSMLAATSIGWVRDDIRGQSFKQVLYDLSHRSAEREQFLRVDATDAPDAEVACLHYNFAREVVRESMNRTTVATDLIKALDTVITAADNEELLYLAALCRDIGSYLGAFVAEESAFLSRYINSSSGLHLAAVAEVLWILVETRDDSRILAFLEHLNALEIATRINVSNSMELAASANMLRYLSPMATLHRNLLSSLDINALATAASSARPSQFSGAADLLRELGTRRVEMLESLDIDKLATAANSAQTSDLGFIGELLRQLGARRGQLLENLDLRVLGSKGSSAKPTEFGSLAMLLGGSGNRRRELIDNLDVAGLIGKVNDASAADLRRVADLIWELGEHNRARFDSTILPNLNLVKLATAIGRANPAELGGAAQLIRRLGRWRYAIIEHIDVDRMSENASRAQPAEFASVASVLLQLGKSRGEFVEALDVEKLAAAASRARAGEFSSVADLLPQLGERRGEFVEALDVEKLAAAASRARAREFTSVADLLRQLGERRGEFVEALDVKELAVTASHAQARDQRGVKDLQRELGKRLSEVLDT